MPAKKLIIRRNEDSTIDEVVIRRPDLIHVEQMSGDYWWIGIDFKNGERWTLHFFTGTGDDTGEPIRSRIEKDN